MPVIVEVPGVGELEFPDGMTDDEMSSAILSNFPGLGKPTPSLRPDIPPPGKMEAAQPAAPSLLDRSMPEVPAELKAKEVARSTPKEALDSTFREYDQLKARYGMARELTQDPQKLERLSKEFRREAGRIGVGVLEDKAVADVLLDPLVTFPTVSKEDMAILFPGSKVAQVAGAAQRVVAGAASGLTAPVVAAIPVLPAGGRAAASGAFAAHMGSHVPELARAAGEASVTGDIADKVETVGNLIVTSAFAATAGAHAVTGKAPTKEATYPTKDTTSPTKATDAVRPDTLDPITVAATRAEQVGLPATAAALKDLTGQPEAPKPEAKPKGEVIEEAPQADALEAAAKATTKEAETLEFKRDGKSEADIFRLEDPDLFDLIEERFGEQRASPGVPGESFGRRRGQYEFPTYDEFQKWMDERYIEGDVDGMRLAFAEADTQAKVRYIKENRALDADKQAWISHLATGSPLPSGKPPIARTTPRPMPGATAGVPPVPPGPPTPGRPAPPVPPPRSPTGMQKFDTMALVQLLRQFENFPRVNSLLTSSLGKFKSASNLVELKERLFWDKKLAGEVLGHEVGHFIDLAIDAKGTGKQFARRIDPLRLLKAAIATSADLKREARSLSRAWRGPFKDGDAYRDTAPELFADTLSALFNSPEWVNQNFPRLHDVFDNLKKGKPDFAAAYDEVSSWISGGTMASEFVKQSGDAVRRTQEELLKERPHKERASLKDWLSTQFVTIWHRAAQKEGNVRDIGRSLMDRMEYSKSAAAKWDELWKDDFLQRVLPELEKVSKDPMEGRTLFHAYSQALRTIRERRASGEWIERNPGDARVILAKILEEDAGLRSKFGGQLSAASNADLYDLSAAIFREIHDRGESFASRMADVIDDMSLGLDGERALIAFNVRGKLLNPGGLTPDQARSVMQDIRARLSPDQFAALEKAGKELRGLVSDTVRAAYDEGLISKKAWDELIEPNLDSYLPYAVLDYFDGRVRAGIMQQKGTARDIADVIVSSQLKVSALNAWRQLQLQPVLVRQMYANGGMPLGLGQQLRRSTDLHAIQKRNSHDDISRAVIWQDGKPHLIEFPGDPGKTLERAMESSSLADHMTWMATAQDLTHRLMSMYTTLSLPFLFFRNPARGARTASERTGFVSVGKQLLSPENIKEAWVMARNYAEAAFGGTLDPKLRALIEKEGIAPPRLSATMLRDASNLRDLVANHSILAWQVRDVAPHAQPKWWSGGRAGRKVYEAAEKIFTTYEAFEKIYNYRAAIAKGLPEEKALAVMRRSGIPKPGVGGHFTNPMEVFFPWTRIHLQGMRASFDTWRDPRLGDGSKARFAATELAPRILKIGIATGVISGSIPWLIRKDEDKKDPVMPEVFRRISPYKMALDDVVPLMFHDPRTGQYHFFNEYKSGTEVPKHLEVVSLRIPASEEGRMWGPLLYGLLANSPNIQEQAGKPGEGMMSSAANWAKNYMAPGISPAIETSKALFDMIGRGKNPEDPYRGQPSANRQMFDAGGGARAEAIAGYTLNQMGGPGEIAGVLAMNFGLLDDRAMSALSQRLKGDHAPLAQKLPIIKSMLAFDNYGEYRGEKNAELTDAKVRAQAKLIMSEQASQLYSFYYRNVRRKDKLDAADQIRFNIASTFVNNIFGDMKTDGSFYNRAVHVVTEGSRQARETFKLDLDTASAGLYATFENADAIAETKAKDK